MKKSVLAISLVLANATSFANDEFIAQTFAPGVEDGQIEVLSSEEMQDTKGASSLPEISVAQAAIGNGMYNSFSYMKGHAGEVSLGEGAMGTARAFLIGAAGGALGFGMIYGIPRMFVVTESLNEIDKYVFDNN